MMSAWNILTPSLSAISWASLSTYINIFMFICGLYTMFTEHVQYMLYIRKLLHNNGFKKAMQVK